MSIIRPKIQITGSTTDIPFIHFVQSNAWTTSNHCLRVDGGYTFLNGLLIDGSNFNSNTITSTSNIGINVIGNGSLIFSTSNRQRLLISSNGNIGIGTNINNNYLVNINGNINASLIYKNNIEIENIFLRSVDNVWVVNTNNNNNIYNKTLNSSVGINNSNPLGTLHIGTTSNISDGTFIISKSNVFGSNRQFKYGYDDDLNFIMGDFGNSNSVNWKPQVIINSNASSYSINITSNNFVGIYNSNPQYTLDVNGNINANKFLGVGSNITNIDYSNITINVPPSSNLNNWIQTSNGSNLYTLFSNVSINTLSNTSNYTLNINGNVNSTDYFNNNINISNIYLSQSNASNIYLTNSNALTLYGSWINTGIRDGFNATIHTSNLLNYTVGINTSTTRGFILNVNGSSFFSSITGDGFNITNINFANINVNTLPGYISSNAVYSLFYDKIYLDNTYSNAVATNTIVNVFRDQRFVSVSNICQTLLGNGTNTDVIDSVAKQIAESANFTNLLNFASLQSNPIRNYLINPNTNRSFIGINTSYNLNDTLTINGSMRVSSDIYSSNTIFESNLPLNNVYVSSNVLNNYLSFYQTTYNDTINHLSPLNTYPPLNNPFVNHSNIVTTSRYGNGLYISSFSDTNPSTINNIFNENTTNWTPTNPLFNYSLNFYYFINAGVGDFNFMTRLSGSVTYYGNFFQLYTVNSFILNSFSIVVKPNVNGQIPNGAPDGVAVFGTNDRSILTVLPGDFINWTLLYSRDNISSLYTSNTVKNSYEINNLNINNSNLQSYCCYRVVVTKLINDMNIVICQLKLFGYENVLSWFSSGSNLYYTSGNVGINTINDVSPYALNVNGAIFTNSNLIVNSNIGISNINPLAYLHVGNTSNISDGTIVVSKNDTNGNLRNFKMGYDTNLNFVFGDFGNLSNGINTWTSQFYINSNAPANSLFINRNGQVGIGTTSIENTNSSILYVEGSASITSNITTNSNLFLTNDGCFITTGSNPSSYLLTSNIYTSNINCSCNLILINNGSFITTGSNPSSYLLTSNIYTSNINCSCNLILINDGSFITTGSNPNSYLLTSNIYTSNINCSCNLILINDGSFITTGSNPSSYLLTSNIYTSNINCSCNLILINDGSFITTGSNPSSYLLTSNIYTSNINCSCNLIVNSNISTSNFITSNITALNTTTINGLLTALSNVSIRTDIDSNYSLNVNGAIFTNSNLIVTSNIGISNINPLAYLHVGSTSNISDGTIVVSKNDMNGYLRNFKFGYDTNLNFVFGDFGNLSNGINTWTSQFYINSNAPENSLFINRNGQVGIGTTSIPSDNSSKLYIGGSGSITGSVDISGSITTSGNLILNNAGSTSYITTGTNTNAYISSSNIYSSNIRCLDNITLTADGSYLTTGTNINAYISSSNIYSSNIRCDNNITLTTDGSYLTTGTNINAYISSSNIYSSNIRCTDNITLTAVGSYVTTGTNTTSYISSSNIYSSNIRCLDNITLTGSGSIIRTSNINASFNVNVDSNITTSNLVVTELTYKGTELNTRLTDYLLNAGGTLTGSLTVSSGFINITSSGGSTSSAYGSGINTGILYWGVAGNTNPLIIASNISSGIPLSLQCASHICAQGYIASSDKRIKNNISNIENSIEIINNLIPKKYNLIETNQEKFGFIAQDVEKICPNAVSITSGIIPNIFEKGFYKNDIINFENKNKISLKVNDVIKIIDKNKYNNAKEFIIKEIIDDNNFIINEELTSEDVFIIGSKIDDFRTIDYNMITSLNTKAIQELFIEIQKIKKMIL